MERREKKKRKWIDKWRTKYRLVFITDDTLEERLTFRLSRLNVFVASGTLAIVLIFLTTILIAFTPLREYIPGYTDVGLTRKLYTLQLWADSVERNLAAKEQYIDAIKVVLTDQDLPGQAPLVKDTNLRYDRIKLKKSEEDSLLRIEMEALSRYNINRLDGKDNAGSRRSSIGTLLFFTPLKGLVTSEFDIPSRRYGIDIAAGQNDAVKSVLDGTVILTNWTLESGYVIIIQHPGNIVSVYMHNSAILKKTGETVRAGEPVAIAGGAGELSGGPSLHFELWSDGLPVNPRDYITF